MSHSHYVVVDEVTWAESPESVETTQYHGDLNMIKDFVFTLRSNSRKEVSIYTDYCCDEAKRIVEGENDGNI